MNLGFSQSLTFPKFQWNGLLNISIVIDIELSRKPGFTGGSFASLLTVGFQQMITSNDFTYLNNTIIDWLLNKQFNLKVVSKKQYLVVKNTFTSSY
jgi:hypothetical protein